MTFCSDVVPAPEDVRLVAEVKGDLSNAWNLTQNFEHAWCETRNENVNCMVGISECFDRGVRSTAVGDVMEIDGVFFIVAAYGFREIPNFKIEATA